MSVWDPFAVARRMQSWDDLFETPEWDDTELDMYEEDDKVVLQLKAPGFDDKNVDITVQKEEQEDKKKKYYKKEISQRSFTRTVSLPSKVMPEEAKAEFKNGILHLELPKAEESKPKKVNIKVN